jgi:hypothetical protein
MWRNTKTGATGVKTRHSTEQNECNFDVRAAALLKIAANLATATAALVKARPVLLETKKKKCGQRDR